MHRLAHTEIGLNGAISLVLRLTTAPPFENMECLLSCGIPWPMVFAVVLPLFYIQGSWSSVNCGEVLPKQYYVNAMWRSPRV